MEILRLESGGGEKTKGIFISHIRVLAPPQKRVRGFSWVRIHRQSNLKRHLVQKVRAFTGVSIVENP